ncbi:rCG61752 [Rattus norvegicus]|uniref:RCG61752 n=1 Tax=Rattus norvegicus TaxID=10116 RepID=A6HB89_RAT|nr:rCG61752 [Rattus norvegicus]
MAFKEVCSLAAFIPCATKA